MRAHRLLKTGPTSATLAQSWADAVPRCDATSLSGGWKRTLQCKAKMQYLLTFQVSSYRLLTFWVRTWCAYLSFSLITSSQITSRLISSCQIMYASQRSFRIFVRALSIFLESRVLGRIFCNKLSNEASLIATEESYSILYKHKALHLW